MSEKKLDNNKNNKDTYNLNNFKYRDKNIYICCNAQIRKRDNNNSALKYNTQCPIHNTINVKPCSLNIYNYIFYQKFRTSN